MARGYLCVITLRCLISVTFAFIDITVDKLPATSQSDICKLTVLLCKMLQ